MSTETGVPPSSSASDSSARSPRRGRIAELQLQARLLRLQGAEILLPGVRPEEALGTLEVPARRHGALPVEQDRRGELVGAREMKRVLRRLEQRDGAARSRALARAACDRMDPTEEDQ